MTYDFKNYKGDSLTKPRDLAWDNWAKFEKVGDKVQGFIADAFYRAADGQFRAQRGITLKQVDGSFINVGIKRTYEDESGETKVLSFVLSKTDNLRIGDPLTIELVELKKASTKGFSDTKIYGFFGKNLDENKGNPTISELEAEDIEKGGTVEPVAVETAKGEVKPDDVPFP